MSDRKLQARNDIYAAVMHLAVPLNAEIEVPEVPEARASLVRGLSIIAEGLLAQGVSMIREQSDEEMDVLTGRALLLNMAFDGCIASIPLVMSEEASE